ncbi:abnormal spindle-like microcephaly-associated protein [Hyperolius riggenbachi]|uniref:abnormal spindle-like microcephaly-associated protein n=1 Tax=Hyperolius riggenbachi TaxID=752182 RepID=UPI0035A3130F
MLSISPPAGGPGQKPSAEETPVLCLTHFSRPPFVSFGCVPPGSARSAVLLLKNPSPDLAQVTVHKLPEHRGFLVQDTDLLIQPFETIPLTITWNPLEEGGIRELITFVVNDIVKHQAVLLGHAELPAKKKRARWNTRKMKSPVGSKHSGPRKKELCTTVIKHKPFSLTQKNVNVTTGRARSPLQSRENISIPDTSPTQIKKARRSTENRAPLHCSPPSNDLEDFAPGELRRSKTYSVLCTTEYETIQEVTTTTVQKDFVIEEEQWTLTEHRVDKLSISPINPIHHIQHNYTCTPSMLNEFKTLSPTEFYNAELTVKCMGHPSEKSISFEESTLECFLSANSKMQSSPSVLLTPQRNLSNLESVVNYVSDGYLSATHHTPTLSPDQFVRENFLTPPSVICEAGKKESQSKRKCVDKGFVFKTSGDPEPVDSRLTYCVKKKPAGVSPLLLKNGSSVAKPSAKAPVNSKTITKVKALDCNNKPHKSQLKSRRRLRNIELDDKLDSQVAGFEHLLEMGVLDLPVINVSSSPVHSESPVRADSTKPICGRKRKSDGVSVASAVPCAEALNVDTQPKKSHISKPSVWHHVSNKGQEQSNGVVSSARKVWKSPKVNHETMKGKPQVPGDTQVKKRLGRIGDQAVRRTDKTSMPQVHSALTFKTSKRVVAVPQSKLTFMKTTKTVIPRHPMPFAAKNMFYDERWIEKQERGFTWWLNFILTPDDFAVKTDSTKVNAAALILGEENNHKVSVPKAPTKEEVSLKAYTARCRLNRLRRSACRLFTSETVVKAIRRLEVEIEARRLLVRKDRHLWKDVGERQKILNWLLSYNPLWLRVGLETIFGELISLESNSDITGLAVFILNRLLWNPDIAAEYRHPSVPHLYREGHEEALSKFTLKKLLLLVFFVDYAKQSRLIDHDPCLFCKDAEFKTSKDLLLAFSRDFLSGEGDLSRHLGYLGLPVSHVQTPLDEFDFAVTNLAVDLQCGVRLVRTMELLTQNWSLSKKLRVPAISRLQKMHNVEVAMQVLTERGVQIKNERGIPVTSKDIVDRHRERTLALLWTIVFTFQVEVLLNIDSLKEEIKFLKKSYSTQKKLAALRALSFPAITRKRDSDPFSPENYSQQVLLLMEWVNAVCAFYNTKVENFTVPFSDGRVFCYLIHHYHPSYLSLHAINQRPTQTMECNETGTVGLNSSSDSENSLDAWHGMCEQGFTTSSLYKELLENERSNFNLLQTAVSNLGGIPSMIHHSDTSNTIPDEKVIITFLSFLCARLLDLRKEARAARVIQAAWRKYKVTAEEQLLQKKHKAASIIQTAVRKFLKRRWILKSTTSALVIQKHWRRYVAYKELKILKLLKRQEIRTAASIAIQKSWRMYTTRKYYKTLRRCAVLLQARIRTKIAVLSYKQTTHAARTLQMHLRSWLLAKKERENFIRLKSASVIIQSAFRQWRCIKQKRQADAALVIQRSYRKYQQRRLESKRKAAVVIQSMYCMSKERRKFLSLQAAAVKIQSLFKMSQQRTQYLFLRKKTIFVQRLFQANLKMRKERKSYLEMQAACIKLQSAVRGHLVRRKIKLWHRAATTVQAHYRMHVKRKEYLAIYRAAVVIQERIRASKEAIRQRELFLLMKCTAVRIQAAFRGYIIRKRLKVQHLAALNIQTAYRRHVVRMHYVRTRQSVLMIQRWYREQTKMKKDVEHLCKSKRAVTTIQAAYRGYIFRKRLKVQHLAALNIQTAYRRHVARRHYAKTRQSILTIQRWYRAHKLLGKDLEHFCKSRKAITTIQAAFRGWIVRKQLHKQKIAAVTLQSAFRKFIAQRRFVALKQAARTLQRHYRALLIGRKERNKYIRVCLIVRKMQASWRGKKVRREIESQHRMATLIQSYYRMHVCYTKHKNIKQASVIIQCRYRAYIAGKAQREHYLKIKGAATALQAVYRGWRDRKHLLHLHNAACIIQASYRSFSLRKEYLRLKTATTFVQRRYCAVTAAKFQREQYVCFREKIIKVQSFYRGMKMRRRFLQMRKSAVLLQSMFRMRKRHVEYQRIKQATISVQKQYRAVVEGKKQRQQYLALKKAACTIQAIWRGRKVREQLRRMHAAATLIQSHCRMVTQRRAFKKLKKVTIAMQQSYRASRERNRQMLIYSNLRKAAVCIQSTFRAVKMKQEFKAKRRAAVVLQSAFRTFLARRRFIALQKAAVCVQRRFKLKMLAASQRQDYMKFRGAAILLQAAFRGYRGRQNLRKMHFAATVIQTTFRMHKDRVAYQKLKQSTVTIQRCYRAFKMAAHEREIFLQQRRSAVMFQAAYRGGKVRRHISKMKEAASKIQATFRMHHCRNQYKKLQWAVHVVQQRYRANKLRDFEVLRYSFIMDATLCIQAACRGWHVRKELRSMHAAATIIQSQFRAYLERRHYLLMRSSAVVVQRRYRATVLMHQCSSQFQMIRKAIIQIQASYRGFRVRKDIAVKHAMATRIQSTFKMHKELVLYRSKQTAARQIQSWYRSVVKCRHMRASFLKLRGAAVLIQACYKGMMVRKKTDTMIRAATTIQANYRMYVHRKGYKNLLKATRTVQQRFRANKARDQDLSRYHTTIKSAVILQAAYRGLKVRREIQRMHHASTVIQKVFKGFLQKEYYAKLRSAAVCLQRRYRANVVARSQRLDFLTCCKAAVCIQSAYKGYKQRKLLKQNHRAATKIQAVFRMHRQHRSYQAQRASAILIQRFYRNQKHVLCEKERYLKPQNAAIVVQASYRGVRCRKNLRKMHDAATVVQAFYRMHRQRTSYWALQQATRTLQSHFRAKLLREEAAVKYNNLRKAVVCLQRAFRARKLRREVRRSQAALLIQTTWRMYQKRRAKAALAIQAAWRMHQERKAFIRAKSAAVTLQAAFRGHRTRKKFNVMEKSAFCIQSWFRRSHHVRLQRALYLNMRSSAIIIQSALRGYLTRKRLKQERAATVLQCYHRMSVCRREFLKLRASAIMVQAYYRMHRTMQLYKKQRACAVTIQQWYRSVNAMRHQRAAYLNTQRQIICVQAAVRRFLAQRSFRKLQHAALLNKIAQWKTERRLQRFSAAAYHHLCAIKIQRCFRAHLTLTRAKEQIHHVIYIQRWYRLRLQQRKFLYTRQKIIYVQRVVQSWLQRRNKAAIQIQRCVKVYLQRKRQAKVAHGIVKLQALWRGYHWRKVHDTKVLRKLRNSLQKVNEATKDEDRLCNRTSVALHYLLTYKHFCYILAALQHLEVATRLSAVCCENMAQSGAVKIIFTLIRNCNRSIPCMEVIKLSIQVLLNLSKYNKTVKAVYEVEESVEILLDLMQIYREKPGDKVPEKGGSIFTKACCLLAIFAQNTQRAQEICAIPKAINRISSIYNLTSRKHKMDTARNISKQLMNSSRIHGDVSFQATPVRTRIVSRIKPDWMLRKDNMREIVDPLKAIQMVMSTFGLPI